MNIFKSEQFNHALYYILIGVLSFLMVFFLPFLGSTVGLGWNIPNTTAGWVVFVVTKLIVSAMSVLIFHCFMLQAKINIKDNEDYKRANEILGWIKDKEVAPRSPKQWHAKQYGIKGTTTFISSALTTVALTQAMFTFNWVEMLSYLFSVIIAVIFGLLAMKSEELYWTEEYYQYALVEENKEKMEKENVRKEQCSISQPDGTSIEESV